MYHQKRGSLRRFCLLWFGATAGIGALSYVNLFLLASLSLQIDGPIGLIALVVLIYLLCVVVLPPICIGLVQGLLLDSRYPQNRFYRSWSRASSFSILLPIAAVITGGVCASGQIVPFLFITSFFLLLGLFVGHVQASALPFNYRYRKWWRRAYVLAWLLASLLIGGTGLHFQAFFLPVLASPWFIFIWPVVICWISVGLITSLALYFILRAGEKQQLPPRGSRWYVPSAPAQPPLTQSQRSP